MCPHTAVCVHVLLYVCPHILYVSAYCYICVHVLLYVCALNSSFFVNSVRLYRYLTVACSATAICVRILLYMCLHTAIYVSTYYFIRVLIILYVCPHATLHSLSSRRSAHIYIRHIPTYRYTYIPIYRYICYTFSHRSACSLLRDAGYFFS